MDERVSRLRNHKRNISRYQNMHKTRLSEAELRFVEKRLAEERFKIAMLEFMSPPRTQGGSNLYSLLVQASTSEGSMPLPPPPAERPAL